MSMDGCTLCSQTNPGYATDASVIVLGDLTYNSDHPHHDVRQTSYPHYGVNKCHSEQSAPAARPPHVRYAEEQQDVDRQHQDPEEKLGDALGRFERRDVLFFLGGIEG